MELNLSESMNQQSCADFGVTVAALWPWEGTWLDLDACCWMPLACPLRGDAFSYKQVRQTCAPSSSTHTDCTPMPRTGWHKIFCSEAMRSIMFLMLKNKLAGGSYRRAPPWKRGNPVPCRGYFLPGAHPVSPTALGF